MKKLYIFIIASLSFSLTFSQTLPFFDDFENGISGWTTQNTVSTSQWYWNTDEGYNASNSASFTLNLTKPYDVNEAWFVSPSLNTTAATHVKINFKYMRWGDNLSPQIYYTTDFTGDVSSTSWTEVEGVSWGTDLLQYYDISTITAETAENNFWFAFRYQTTEEIAAAFYVDNFSIESYTPPAEFELVGSSEHFEFYTNLVNEESFFDNYVDKIETEYAKYISLWERPSSTTIFPEVDKLKISYCSRLEMPDFDKNTPLWDCGNFYFSSGEIFICPLDNDLKLNYYENLGVLICNELSQMAITGWMDRDLDKWYTEGFGLYEMGYRPERQQLLDILTEMGTEEPPISSLENIDDLTAVGKKDLMASFFQTKAILRSYWLGKWGDDPYYWWQLLKHYYLKDADRIELRFSTEHFDYYATTKEVPLIEALAIHMEEQMSLQEGRFQQSMNHRVNVCIYDNEVGLEINNATDFQAYACGAEIINTMPLDIGGYGGVNHEFMHLWVNMMSPIQFISATQFLPGQFLNEGLASSTDSFMTDEEMPWHNNKIQYMFYHYQRKYNREPSWLEIVDNAEVNKEDGMWVDAYSFGEMYWRYMNDKYPEYFWLKVKLFLNGGRDWTVFGGKSTEQEGTEFIQFMKELAFVGPPLETTSLPFYEDFETDFDGWTLLRYGVDDDWQIQENIGVNDSFCAYVVDPYWMEDKDVDSWLVSPPLECNGNEKIDVSFSYNQGGQGIKPEVYYAGNFTGAVDPVDWVLVESVSWDAPEYEWGEMKFTIENAPDRLNIAIRYLSEEGNYTTYIIDDFKAESSTLGIEDEQLKQGITFYPNPVSNKLTIKSELTLTKVDIFSVLGQKVLEINSNFKAISTESLPKGMYMVRIFSEESSTIVKMIKE